MAHFGTVEMTQCTVLYSKNKIQPTDICSLQYYYLLSLLAIINKGNGDATLDVQVVEGHSTKPRVIQR